MMKTTADNVKRLTFLILLCIGWADSAAAVDHVVLRRDGKQIHVDGRLVLTAQDGGLLVMARDGVLWAVPPEEQVKHTSDELPFKPLSREEMSRRLLDELPRRFAVHETAHYLICYNTSRAYAQWCGSLFERLYMAFTNYWSRKGFKLSEPEFPLVAIVFADQRSYTRFSKAELGDAAPSIIGYFSLRTNRMMMYDLTGMEALSRFGHPRGTAAQINRILARPEALRTVSTIVHEATHQIAFNCGLHNRYSDCPVWFSEGIALYFETPDLRSSKGWRGIGAVNRGRLARFQFYLRNRGADSLQTLLADDKRFHDTKLGLDAYAEAWALAYYLIRNHPRQYVDYLKMLSKKQPLVTVGAQTRLKEFEQFFGDLEQLDTRFVRAMSRMR